MRTAGRSAANLSIIGLSPEEHEWVRLLLGLLRDPDPVRSELAREALVYLESAAGRPAAP
jgi:hypothetical protein